MKTILFETNNDKAAKAVITRLNAAAVVVKGYTKGVCENGETKWTEATKPTIYPVSSFSLAKKAAVMFAATLSLPTVDEAENEFNALVLEGVDFSSYMPE